MSMCRGVFQIWRGLRLLAETLLALRYFFEFRDLRSHGKCRLIAAKG
jgi:hypothetical protein